jgi:hypothetical protein
MIHVLDELSVRPGHLAQVRRQVSDLYQPAATSLGMTLMHTWLAPGVELQDDPTDLLLLWKVADTAAYWKARREGAQHPDVIEFWAGLSPWLTGRKRRLLVDPDDESVLR